MLMALEAGLGKSDKLVETEGQILSSAGWLREGLASLDAGEFVERKDDINS
jgi:hypothetical protein